MAGVKDYQRFDLKMPITQQAYWAAEFWVERNRNDIHWYRQPLGHPAEDFVPGPRIMGRRLDSLIAKPHEGGEPDCWYDDDTVYEMTFRMWNREGRPEIPAAEEE